MDRPLDHTPVHTDDLPATPTRDRTIPVTAWIEAPETARTLGDGLATVLGDPGRDADHVVGYKRRIGRWLLWRAGPAKGDHARYLAIAADDLSQCHRFDLDPDGSGRGQGPSAAHTRFRTWKEDLRDHG